MKGILLDDYGMLLKRNLFSAHEDFIASAAACPEWRAMNMGVAERKVDIYRHDLIPRLHACVDRMTDFIAHYFMLFYQWDIQPVRHLEQHLLIDKYAHGMILATRKKLRRWNTTSEEAELAHDLVVVLSKCECGESVQHQRALSRC